jgi:hypothetical protein
MANEKVAELVSYFDRIRERTMRVAACVPPEKIDWTYREGKFTLGDLMRHLGAIERWMFAENAQRRPSAYPGHGRELADGREAIVDYMSRMHGESMAIFREEVHDARRRRPAHRKVAALDGRARGASPRADSEKAKRTAVTPSFSLAERISN